MFLSRAEETLKAVKKFFRKLLKGLRDLRRVIMTDNLKKHSAAKDEVMPSVEHIQPHMRT
jgi:putative transposase